MKTLIGEDYFTDWNLSSVGPKVYWAFEASSVEKSQVDNLWKKKKVGEEKGNFCSGKVSFSDANRNPSYKGRSWDELP